MRTFSLFFGTLLIVIAGALTYITVVSAIELLFGGGHSALADRRHRPCRRRRSLVRSGRLAAVRVEVRRCLAQGAARRNRLRVGARRTGARHRVLCVPHALLVVHRSCCRRPACRRRHHAVEHRVRDVRTKPSDLSVHRPVFGRACLLIRAAACPFQCLQTCRAPSCRG